MTARLHPSVLGLSAAAAALATAAAAVATLHGFSCNVSYEPAIRTTEVALFVALPLWLIGTGFSANSLSRRRWLVLVALVELAAGIAILLYLHQQTRGLLGGYIDCR